MKIEKAALMGTAGEKTREGNEHKLVADQQVSPTAVIDHRYVPEQ